MVCLPNRRHTFVFVHFFAVVIDNLSRVRDLIGKQTQNRGARDEEKLFSHVVRENS